ncbi:cysteine hydrolase family protein [Desulfobacca acetoxidans]|uniref:Isochorismatase hydrolase n=1 Tax=Desulfobacca acetoxidans (strain ATCC 700848 / DSM 11109 / ASRB2) TaxID=880072 RepID=F2ND13_DESAR|nr:isochorismatase family cysteine hydrolase [Desulfobacca acetoxidans]AEB09587.1 isochorismatase hydrolase [Desulfobacca acetoxidans DSM 11109]
MPAQALIIIDMINDFLNPAGSLYVGGTGRAIIPFVAAKMQEMRLQGALIVLLTDAHDPNDPEFSRFPPHAVQNTWGAELIGEIKAVPSDVRVTKKQLSGMLNTDLEKILQRQQINEVHLVGVCTSICIMETARDLDLRGYRVVVYRDGVADFDPGDHEWALKRMARLFGVQVV